MTAQPVDRLRELLAKATPEKLTDGGRYFAESCADLTRCRHEEIGEYQNSHDGELIEWLWNNAHALLEQAARVERLEEALREIDAAIRDRSYFAALRIAQTAFQERSE